MRSAIAADERTGVADWAGASAADRATGVHVDEIG